MKSNVSLHRLTSAKRCEPCIFKLSVSCPQTFSPGNARGAPKRAIVIAFNDVFALDIANSKK